MPNLLPFAAPPALTGWYRLNKRARWHLFRPYPLRTGTPILIPWCGRGIAIRTDTPLTQQTDLPQDAPLCTGCAKRKATT